MDITSSIREKERGQSLVIVALMLIALLGMLALVIDGGMTYASRRTTQNAADAGALAGAAEYCKTGNQTTARQVANTYVVSNTATVDPAVDITFPNSNTISVVAHKSFSTFVAGILNRPEMEVAANASAGCFNACELTSFMPVAWSCKATITSTVPTDPVNCVIQTGKVDEPGPLYILMDSESISNDCISNGGSIDCDLDPSVPGDEVFTGGNRGFLNLNQDVTNCGTSNLVSWIYGTGITLQLPSWLGKCEGDKNVIYDELADLITNRKNIVVLPVFDDSCPGDPRTTPGCRTYPGDTFTIKTGGNDLNYHIVDTSVVRLTCVQQGKSKVVYDPIIPLTTEGDCPARAEFIADNTDLTGSSKINDSSLNTVEGYFVSDYDSRIKGACGPQDPNSGPYTIYLK